MTNTKLVVLGHAIITKFVAFNSRVSLCWKMGLCLFRNFNTERRRYCWRVNHWLAMKVSCFWDVMAQWPWLPWWAELVPWQFGFLVECLETEETSGQTNVQFTVVRHEISLFSAGGWWSRTPLGNQVFVVSLFFICGKYHFPARMRLNRWFPYEASLCFEGNGNLWPSKSPKEDIASETTRFGNFISFQYQVTLKCRKTSQHWSLDHLINLFDICRIHLLDA